MKTKKIGASDAFPCMIQINLRIDPDTGDTVVGTVTVTTMTGTVKAETREVPHKTTDEKTGAVTVGSRQITVHRFERASGGVHGRDIDLNELAEEDRAAVERAVEILADAAFATI